MALDKEKKQSKRGQKRVVAKAKARGRGGSIQLSHKMFTAPLSFPPTHSPHFKASGSNCGGERRRRSNLDFFSHNKQRAPEVSAKKRALSPSPLLSGIFTFIFLLQPTPVRYSFDIAAAVSSDRFGTGQLNSENETAAAAATTTCGQQANDEERKRCCRFRLRGRGEAKMKGEICYH